MESQLVAMRHALEHVQDGAAPAGRKEPDASMGYEEAMLLWMMLEVLIKERLSAPRPGEQAKSQGSWTLRGSPSTRFERG